MLSGLVTLGHPVLAGEERVGRKAGLCEAGLGQLLEMLDIFLGATGSHRRMKSR